MAFEAIKNKTTATKGKCALCDTNDSIASIQVRVMTADNKSVASRSAKICEACGTKAFQDAVKAAKL